MFIANALAGKLNTQRKRTTQISEHLLLLEAIILYSSFHNVLNQHMLIYSPRSVVVAYFSRFYFSLVNFGTVFDFLVPS